MPQAGNDLGFDQAMWNIYHTARSLKPPMPASGFRGLLGDRGGKGTADFLLAKSAPSDGFTELYLRGKDKLKLSVEYLVLSNPWRQLFTEAQLAVARKRLVDVECELPPEDATEVSAHSPPPLAAVEPLPEEVPHGTYLEGAVKRIEINAYERNGDARAACLAHYGSACSVCGISFGKRYGQAFEGFIHVHHLKAISEIGSEYAVDPIRDLRPVCPNCHALIHYGGKLRGLEEVAALLR